MRHWNYRLIRTAYDGEETLTMHEVHYEDGEPVSMNITPAIVYGETKEDVIWVLERMREACEKPPLYPSLFNGGEDVSTENSH